MTESRQPPQLRCEHCDRGAVSLHEREDGELWCGNCLDDEAERAWDRHQQDLMENGPGPTLAEQAAEAKKLK